MLRKTASIAALAAAVSLTIPVASWADGGAPAPQQPSGDRIAKIQDRISQVEARIAAGQQKLADLQQKIAAKCNSTAPAPTTGAEQTGQAPAVSLADRCAKAQDRLQKMQDRLQKAQARLDQVKQRIQQWLQNHSGQGAGSGVSSSDQQALAGLQQQLAGLQG